jgi:hypothetical protein
MLTLQAKHDARWEQRFAELSAYRAGGNDCPRHKSPDSEQERVLGIWLHVQRISRREGKLHPDREERLNDSLPGWKEGRARSGGRRPGGPYDHTAEHRESDGCLPLWVSP